MREKEEVFSLEEINREMEPLLADKSLTVSEWMKQLAKKEQERKTKTV